MKSVGLHTILAVIVLGVSVILVSMWVRAASARLAEAAAASQASAAAVASASDVKYCTPALKVILRRVLTSCGLVKSGGQRGCQPLEAKNVAAMSGNDFNALLMPMADRAAILQFDLDKSELDEASRGLLEKTFSNQKGASYFLVVSRASPEGSVEHNRKLSEDRAAAVLTHLKSVFNDPDLEQEVGLLWLGEEFAQLDEEFCKWQRSHTDTTCDTKALNRSAFIAWIDCRL